MRRAYTKIAQMKKISALDDESDSQCRASSDPGCLANLELHWLNVNLLLIESWFISKLQGTVPLYINVQNSSNRELKDSVGQPSEVSKRVAPEIQLLLLLHLSFERMDAENLKLAEFQNLNTVSSKNTGGSPRYSAPKLHSSLFLSTFLCRNMHVPPPPPACQCLTLPQPSSLPGSPAPSCPALPGSSGSAVQNLPQNLSLGQYLFFQDILDFCLK